MKATHSILEILRVSLKLGCTSFGGPVAHLGFFKNEYIDKRKWIDEKTYADIIALCQFLPGPASSQVGIAIGMVRGGLIGGIVSWFGFTIPSVIVLMLFAMLFQATTVGEPTWITSLKIVAVAVVAHAVLGLGKKLTPDKPRIAIAIGAAAVMLLYASTIVQIGVIIAAGLLGALLFRSEVEARLVPFTVSISKKLSVAALGVFVLLLVVLPIVAQYVSNSNIQLFDMFFRVGSLVFGGGHVVLPLLEQEIVPTGLLTGDQFLAGYGMVQAVPGPLFTFASYLGMMLEGVTGAVIATVAIFLPSFLLIIGTLPFLSTLRTKKRVQGMLMGVNASVVGILLAAFFNPVFTSAITGGAQFALAILLFALLQFWRVPAWLVVVIGVSIGQFLPYL
ncbi:chromate efflux transporter [Virgibacillus sp. LDC-1]|uniref:chromate efflux transporter n=1 Tax=Virgibacillus sp. LDC-1 TaxID=3039856 RepID=UPI0024DEDDCA|nr:chromate efflux transporter [Virgibacillus sp. LDC-1]